MLFAKPVSTYEAWTCFLNDTQANTRPIQKKKKMNIRQS